MQINFNIQHCLNYRTQQIDFDLFAQAIAFDGVNPYGNALLSRYPIETAQTILVPDPETRGDDGYPRLQQRRLENIDSLLFVSDLISPLAVILTFRFHSQKAAERIFAVSSPPLCVFYVIGAMPSSVFSGSSVLLKPHHACRRL